MLVDRLKKELQRMEKLNVIEKVDKPAVLVNSLTMLEKPNSKLRTCLDPNDLNNDIHSQHFQIPTTGEIMSKLAGIAYLSTLDASYGYWPMPLTEESSCLTIISLNTPFVRYRYLCLHFGINNIQEVFHKRVS